MFRNISEVEAELAKYIPAVKEITGKDITLERIAPLMEKLGNPQDTLNIIHIAGTSGKTSTAYYIAALLQGNGRKIGLTVSPHIDSITERLQINLNPLPEQEFCEALWEFMNKIEGVDPEPTYFELLVAFAYWYFAKAGVDYAVVETGLGGLHDATNIAQKPDKICVITDIGHDHMKFLGSTLEKISAQKAGIIHASNQVFMYEQSDEVTDVFRERINSKSAKLNLVNQNSLKDRYELPELKELPVYQRRNWLLAREVSEFVAQRDRAKLDNDSIKNSLDVQVPGRMDIRQVDGKTLVMDGAHNEQKMTAFVESFGQMYPGKKAAVLLSLKRGKEFQAVLPLLKPIASRIIITSFDAVQDLPIPSMDADELAGLAKSAGLENVSIEQDARIAFEKLLGSQDETLIVTGSFFLVALVRSYMKNSSKIRVIAAIDDKRGLATDEGIPWNLPSDKKFVREKTMGGNLLMGYNTYLEFPRALEGRHWYVVHEPTEPLREGFESVTDLNEFMKNPPENLWLFGGAGVFAQTIDSADELYLTRVEGDYHCTKIFPEFEDKFKLAGRSEKYSENGISYRFEVWERKVN